jgi:hypothetical protein
VAVPSSSPVELEGLRAAKPCADIYRTCSSVLPVKVRLTRSLATFGVVAALSGCGDSAASDVRAVSDGFLDSVERADWSAACAVLAPITREHLEMMTRSDCAHALPALDLRMGRVTEVQVWGGQALVRTTAGDFFLTEFGDDWLIGAAGCQPSGDAPADCFLEGT